MLVRTMLFVFGFCFFGCQDRSNEPMHMGSVPRVDGADVARGQLTGAESTLPLTVRTAFYRDFPRSTITNVTPQTAASGQPIYRIVFYTLDNQPVAAVYHADGTFIANRSSALRETMVDPRDAASDVRDRTPDTRRRVPDTRPAHDAPEQP